LTREQAKMAAIINTPLTSPEEYVARYVEGGEKPMCEYIDGELRPKPMATTDHSRVQANILFDIRRSYGDRFEALPELTVRLRDAKFYVPNIAVEELARPIPGRYPGPGDPVFLCIEIKSPEDRIGKLFSKCEEYHAWGVPYSWVIDPARKVAWEYIPEDAEPRKAATALNAGPIEIALLDIFRKIGGP
jgi:Uma2 family endonuclease